MENTHLLRGNSEDIEDIFMFAHFKCLSLPQLPTSDGGTVMFVSFNDLIYMCICMTVSLCCAAEIISTL